MNSKVYVGKLYSSLIKIINYKTITITFLSLGATYICHHFGYTADFPQALIATAIVFPIVFSINSAYQRREAALKSLAQIKSGGLCIYYAARDWGDPKFDQNNPFPERVKSLCLELLMDIELFFIAQEEIDTQREQVVYSRFSDFSKLIREMRTVGITPSEISRLSQYLNKMIMCFEEMKLIISYPTPITLRAYSKVFIFSFPIIYGPFFAHTFKDYTNGLSYVLPILYSFVLVSLDNIQEHLENPYDQLGEDDIRIEVKEYMKLFVDQEKSWDISA
ncbi:MAG: hypothetical protein LC115_09930 [Bacteroidia bacterium]|nr:hypothetical protein [Bacteroidia bacterium]